MSSILGTRAATVKFVLVQMPQISPWVQIFGQILLSGCLSCDTIFFLQGGHFLARHVRPRPGRFFQEEGLQFSHRIRGTVFILEHARRNVMSHSVWSLCTGMSFAAVSQG